MQTEAIRHELEKQIDSSETKSELHSAHDRQPALRPFDSGTDIVAFLRRTDIKGMHARSTVTRALIEEAQRRKHSCWSAILLVAYLPGLLRLRGSLTRKHWLTRDDLDWIVIESFLEVVEDFPLKRQGKRAVSNLMFGTRKLVCARLRREWNRVDSEHPIHLIIDEQQLGSTPSAEYLLINRNRVRFVSPAQYWALLNDLCKDEPKEDVSLLFDTYLRDKPLIEYVNERWAKLDPKEIMGCYSRCRQRRNRLVQRLRDKYAERSFSSVNTRAGSRTSDL